MTLMDIQNLTIEYETEQGALRAVDDVSLSIEEGETLGLVGESGCGKTTVAKSLLGILDDNGQIVDGEIEFKGRDLATYSEDEFRAIRWKEISWIAQNAMNALNPVYKTGAQIVEVIRYHTDDTKEEARERTKELLHDVGLDPNTFSDYPHELSGGQRQRVVIALALALNPSFIIADEPTTGLDVVVQDEILRLISSIQAEFGNSMIFITHDMSAVAEIADRVAVMYGGRLVEVGDVSDVFKEMSHPYTMGLRNAFPSITEQAELVSIPGQPPDLHSPPTGCVFANRCPFATETCKKEPQLETIGARHKSKCHYNEYAERMREESKDPKTWTRGKRLDADQELI